MKTYKVPKKGFISFEVLETWAIETKHKDLSVDFIDHCIRDLKHWRKECKEKYCPCGCNYGNKVNHTCVLGTEANIK